MSFSALDIVFGLIIILFTFGGWRRGLVDSIVGTFSIAIAIIVAGVFYTNVAQMFASSISSEVLRKVVAFVIVLIATFIVLKIIQGILRSILRGNILGAVDKVLGLVLGLVIGFFISLIVLRILVWQDFVNISELLLNSFFYDKFGAIVNDPDLIESLKNAAKEITNSQS